MTRPRSLVAVWVICAAVIGLTLLSAYAWAAPRQGLVWPYPQRLPDRFVWGGHNFQNDQRCFSLSGATQFLRGATPKQVGTLRSAIVVGAPDVLGAKVKYGPTPTLFVRRASGCYEMYGMSGDM
jgi:hypothetical protein